MKLNINKYTLEHDGMCVVLSFIRTTKPGSKKEEAKVIVGYYPDTKSALMRLLELEIAESDAVSIKQLIASIECVEENIIKSLCLLPA